MADINKKIVLFLVNRNWKISLTNAKFFELMPPIEIGLPDTYRLSIPNKLNRIDSDSFMSNVINIVSDFYEINSDDLKIILDKNNTVFKIRMYDEFNKDGKIAFSKFEEIMSRLKTILIDTASFVIDKSVASSNTPIEVNAYINKCNFLQTEKGSFVAKIQLPSKELIKNRELFNEREIFSEEINNKLSEVLDFVNKNVFNGDINNMSDEYLLENESKLNIRLLKGIHALYEKAELKNVDFSFHNISNSSFIETKEISRNKVFKLAQFVDFVSNKNIETDTISLRGQVIGLVSRNPDGKKSKIFIGGIYKDMPVRATAYLDSDDYMSAIEAHKVKQYVNIDGLVKKTKTNIRFLEVAYFSVEI